MINIPKDPDDIIVMEKCSHCKLKAEFCYGQYAIRGSILLFCLFFIDARTIKPLTGKEKFPYSKEKKIESKKRSRFGTII